MARGGKNRRYLAGIDVGGTFTDLVLVEDGGGITIQKVPSIPGDITEGVLAAIAAAEGVINPDKPLIHSLDRLVHGSTVAANSFLERKGANMGFITTKGFKDTLVMRRMYRENMYDTRSAPVMPLVRRDNIFEIEERITKDGRVKIPLNQDDLYRVIDEIESRRLDSVGVCMLFSFRNPAHERAVKRAIKKRLPNLYLSLSCEVCPEIRDYERASTTHLNAYLQPPVSDYLKKLDSKLRGASASLQVMHSHGGVTGAREAAIKPVNLLLSGPAGGVSGSAFWGKVTGNPDIIAFDMGGTSCDISLIRDATPSLSTPANTTSTHNKFEGFDVLTPFIDIHTIGSGGGSVCWLDSGGGLHVGPESMGADPGPACYDRGGTEATVTDADVLLGCIDPEYFLGGDMRLKMKKAREAVGRIAKRLGYSVTQAADGIFRIINANMINAIRVVSVERGHDPRKFALLSYGGAGGVHATSIIEELGIDTAIIPQTASAFSAFGLLTADLRYDFVKTVYRPLREVSIDEVHRRLREMVKNAKAEIGKKRRTSAKLWFDYAADMRYAGRGHDMRVALKGPVGSITKKHLTSALDRAYRETHGYAAEESSIQLINLRVVVGETTIKPKISREKTGSTKPPNLAQKGNRDVYFYESKKFVLTPVYDGHALKPGNRLKGPAVVELPTTTVVLRPGQGLRVDPFRNFVIGRRGVRI